MSGINFNPGSGNPLGNLLPGLGGGGKPGLPGGGPQPPGLNGPGGPDVSAPGFEGTTPGLGGDPLGWAKPHDGLPNTTPTNGLPNPNDTGATPNPSVPSTPNVDNSPLFNPDNPASRLLQGQSAQGNNNAINPFNNGPTQYPPPTLSERALNNVAQYAQLDRPVNYGAMAPTTSSAQSAPAGVALSSNGAASGAAAGSAATAANASNVAPTLTLVANNTANAVPAAPMAGALSQEAMTAQQTLFARLNTLQHANVPGNTTTNAPPPPSETPATLQAVTTNTVNNDPRALPLNNNERTLQQRTDLPPNQLTYTGDGAARRTLRRGGKVDNATLTHWLWSFGRGGVHRPTHENEPELQVVRALQWLFWVLTVVAYACLAMAVILLLPSGSLVSERVSTGGSGLALFLGVVVAAGAWWLGRRLNRR
ncbi:MAG: hypothetical protein ACREP7_13130 [Lysobacter sp.]